MRFAYPLGLLALLAIPALILIYVIKSQYTEQTIPSIYLWQLSERFLKKRKRVSQLSGIICLILEIVAVLCIALAVAQPVFTIPNSAKEYCFILDGSASMNIERAKGETRLDYAKQEIAKTIKNSKDGSRYSLVFVGNSTTVVYEGAENKNKALEQLADINQTWGAAGYADALLIAQDYFDENSSAEIYLYSDKAFHTKNITNVDVSRHENNYAVISASPKRVSGAVTVSGKVISYENDATLQIKLYVDGTACATQEVAVTKLQEASYTLSAPLTDYSALRVAIENADALQADNEIILYNASEGQDNRALIVSDAPYYLQSVLGARADISTDVIATREYNANAEGYANYGLYIFDTCANVNNTPAVLPTGGSVWIFNAQKSIPRSGFSFQNTVEHREALGYYEPAYTKSSASFARKMTNGLTKQAFAVHKYAKYSLNRNFTSIMSVGSDDMLFVGTNENGNRQVVFAFDLHDTNLALKPDFLPLMFNLLNYSFPSVLEKTDFVAGDAMTVNVLSGCSDLQLTSPSGAKRFLSVESAETEVQLAEAGTYTLKATIDGTEHNFLVYAGVPSNEIGESYRIRNGEIPMGTLALEGEATDGLADGYYDGLLFYFILLAVVFLADWGVYCYEQYQLR